MAKAGVGGNQSPREREREREREANERMATALESLARMREKQLKEGIARPVF